MSVDGILSAPSGPTRRKSRLSAADMKAGPKPVVESNLGDFKGRDGFTSRNNPHIGSEAVNPRVSSARKQAGSLSNAAENPTNNERAPNRLPNGAIDLTLPDTNIKKSRFAKFRPRFRRPTKKHFIIGLIVTILIVAGMALKGWMDLNQVFKGGGNSAILNGELTKLSGEGDGRINIMLLGKGGDGHEAPDLTDTILIASIDPINKIASLLSVPRDLWVAPNGYSYGKVNAVYANAKYAVLNGQQIDDQEAKAEEAGIKAIQDELSKDLGIPIHYYVMADFSGFKDAIDNVGGIDIDVKEENTVYERLWDTSAQRSYVLNVGEGEQHFDGTRALFFSRSRQTSVRGDFDRSERQRLVIQALKDKVLSLGTYSNPATISSLLSTFGGHVSTNFSLDEVSRLYDIAGTIPSDSIVSLSLADEPKYLVTTDNINGISIVRPTEGIGRYTDIQAFVRNALRDGFLASEDASVLILNGTEIAGLASIKQTELESFGYKVAKIGTAPTTSYAETILVNLRGDDNKYTLNYLEKRLGVKAIDKLPDENIEVGDADFVILLGQNEAGTN
jgi:LCP family protein required for cell wall assembly